MKKGDTFKVPKWKWVNDETSSEEHGTCGIEPGGTITVMGDYDEATVLCSYNSNRPYTGGTACKSGAVFLIKKAELETYNEKVKEIAEAEKLHKQKVNEIITNFKK